MNLIMKVVINVLVMKIFLVSIIPEDLKTQPSFFYNFTSGEISCGYEDSEATQFPECKKVPLLEREEKMW